MIGYLTGEAFEVFENNLIILVGGVGYKVSSTSHVLEKIKKGDSVAFYITSVIKEDAFDLYGFESINEKNLFELMISVSGIGPRTGIAILSRHKIDDIMNAISRGDVTFFTGIPRLGKKNAQKLIIELGSKMGDVTPLSLEQNQERDELFMALKGFGYQEREIADIMPDIEKNGGTIEKKITFAIKHLGKK